MSLLNEQQRVLDSVRDEREFQDRKWGSQRQLSYGAWCCILVEEVGEVAKALNDKEDAQALYKELIQVAAVAVAWAEAVFVA